VTIHYIFRDQNDYYPQNIVLLNNILDSNTTPVIRWKENRESK